VRVPLCITIEIQTMINKHILVIEDNYEIREVVSWVLEDEGFKVSVIAHQPADSLFDFKADLIVLDEWINAQEGHMFCREIKAIQSLKHVPVVIFSTAMDIELLVETCGADGFVRKPFDITALVTEIKRLLAPSPIATY